MEKGGQYQSLFKSFRRSHPSKEEVGSDQKVTPRPITAQKTVDELLAGRAEIREQRRNIPEEGPDSARRRKSVDHILAGAKVKRPLTYGTRIGQGNGKSAESSESGEPVNVRKQVSDILASSSTVLPRVKSSYSKPLVLHEAKKSPNFLEQLQSTSSYPSITELTEIKKEIKPDPQLRRTQSQRVLFDFSSAIKLSRSKSLQECYVPVRPKVIEEQIELSPSVSTIIFNSSSQTNWHKNKAFDALLSSIEDETETEEFDSRDSEETQTEPFDSAYSWTQNPAKFTSASKSDLRWLRTEAKGSAPDPLATIEEEETLAIKVTEAVSLPNLSPEEEEENLLKFAQNMTQLMLSVINVNNVKSTINISEEIEITKDEKAPKKRKSNVVELDRGLACLNKLAMHTLYCDKSHIACANVPLPNNPDKEKRPDEQEVKNIITVWTVKDPLSPKFYLRVWGQVTNIKLAFPSGIIVAGSHNGGLNIWDIREDEQKHVKFEGVHVRTPSFHTGCLEGENHHSEIIGLEVLAETKSSAQIVSLDKDNKIICWSCIHSPVVDRDDFSVNSVAWSTLRVRVRQVLNLNELFKVNTLTSSCLKVWEGNHKYFLVGTNNGFVGKGRIVASSFETRCEKFLASSRDSLIRIHHIDVNIKINLIIAACGDFSVRLFEMSKQKAIISIACVEVPGKVFWSKQRLSVFYVAFKDQVLIWDLIASDLTPMKKCKSKGIVDFQLVLLEEKECMIILAMGGMKLIRVIPPCDLAPLDENHEKLMRHYITVSL